MTVEDSISLYEGQTGESLTVDQVEKLFTDSKYARAQLSANKNLHTVYRDILNTNVPTSIAAAQARGFTKMSFIGSWYHDPWNNTKWIGPDGHLEAVFNSAGTLVTRDVSSKYMGTFNFFPGPSGFFAHRDADMKPYDKWGN